MKRIGTVELSRESDVAREIIKDLNDAIKRFSEQAQTVSQQNDNNNGLYNIMEFKNKLKSFAICTAFCHTNL